MDTDVRQVLEALPGWETMNAYERTKACCRELAQRGIRIPSWMGIREMIGKGASNDINRGKTDFRQEQADSLKRMNGFTEGVPGTLAPYIQGFWEAAVQHVRQELEVQVQEWQTHIEQAETEKEAAVTELRSTKEQFVQLEASIQILQAQLDAEKAAHAQSQKMFEQHFADISSQRDDLKHALAESQNKLDEALERLEGVQKHALLEIDRSRTAAQKQMDVLTAQAGQAQKEYEHSLAALTSQLSVSREGATKLKQELAALLQEKDSIKLRAERSEAQADHLTTENARLLGVLQQSLKNEAKNRNPRLKRRITKI